MMVVVVVAAMLVLVVLVLVVSAEGLSVVVQELPPGKQGAF